MLKQSQGKLNKKYDYVLIDEAQDFKPSFYQICRALVKNDCLVWCYDDLQNIFHVDIQDTISTFQNEYGAEGINLGELQRLHPDMDNDIVLPKSYRNPKEILVTAHAIGFGIYNDKLIMARIHPNPDYLFTQLLYQGLTRVRSKLALIICSEAVFEKVLALLKNN